MRRTLRPMPEILDRPKEDWTWCWLRWRRTKRSKWIVQLVELVRHEGQLFVRPHLDRNHYPVDFFDEEWEGQFAEAVPPPEGWRSYDGSQVENPG